MTDKNILHMLTPLKHMSPFDVNMALDAGYDAVQTYTGVGLDEVAGLVQDAIFSRSPKLGARTAMFIGGRSASLALDMMERAAKAMVPPFGLSLLADPAGSFTTAAAMVAMVQKTLREKLGKELSGLKVAVFGATGVVGYSASVLAAQQGAEVIMVGYDGPARVETAANEIDRRFAVKVGFADGSSDDKRAVILADCDVALAAARAGVRVISGQQLAAAGRLLIAADVNAVPPSGIEGLNVAAAGEAIAGTSILGLGPLTIGGIKYKTELGLFRHMIASDKPVRLDFREAFALARQLVG